LKKYVCRSAALLLGFVMILFGCSVGDSTIGSHEVNDAGGDHHDSEDITLTMVQTFRKDQQERLQILKDHIRQLERNHPNLTFKLSTVEQRIFRDEKLPAEMAAGDAPDIFDLFGGSDTERYAKAGRLLDLTEFLNKSGLKERFESGALEQFTVDGHIYGLPRAGFAEGFYYNKKIFKKLGLKIPQTWDELLNVIQRTKQAGYIPIALASKDAWAPGMIMNAILVRHMGIDSFKGLMTGKVEWTSPRVVKAFQMFRGLIDMGAFPKGTLEMPYNQQNNLFLHGDAAMIYTGSWEVEAFTNKHEQRVKDDIGFALFPSVPGGKGDPTSINAGYSNGWGFSADVTKSQKKVIYDFIKLTWSEKEQKRKMLEANELPAVKLSDLSGAEPLMVNIANVMKAATSTWPAYDAIVTKDVQTMFNTDLQKLIGGVRTPGQMAKDLQRVTNQSLSR
jgi:raffinose/stachyose/melibiose transport system substrate-binding protein